MELRRYLQLIALRWWIVVATLVVATIATLAIVVPQPSIYEASGTMLIRPKTIAIGDSIDASDVLVRGVKVGATYATIARSELIRSWAEGRLDPSIDTSDLAVSAEMVTDTFILTISVSGPDPRAAHALAAAIQREMTSYSATDETYGLVALDPPDLPKAPVGPNKQLTAAVGIMFGLFAGIGLVLLEQYLRGPAAMAVWSVMDTRTGLRNAAYLGRRLSEEASRVQRTGRGFGFVVLRVERRYGDADGVSNTPLAGEVRRIGLALRQIGPPEIVVAHLDGGLFAALLPDMGQEEADALLAAWTGVVRVQLGGGDPASAARLRTVGATCLCVVDVFVGDPEAIDIATTLMAEGSRLVSTAMEASPEQDTSEPPTDRDGGASSEPGTQRDETVAPPEIAPDAATARQGDGAPARAEPAAGKAMSDPNGARDPRGDARRRRAAWKGSSHADNRAG